MAAKENQALQIALIIFFVLTVGASVCAFIFFRKYEDALLSAKASVDEKKKAVESQFNAEKERDEIKRILGADAADNLTVIKEAFDNDIKTYGASVKDSEKFYRPLVKVLHTDILGADVKLVEAKQREEDLKTKIAANDKAKAAEIAEFRKKLDQAAADLASERASFTESREEIEKGKTEIAKQNDVKRKDGDDQLKKSTDEITGLNSTIERLQQRIRSLEEKMQTTSDLADLPRGKILFVNQRDRIVWINVGPADGLRRQITFKVLPPDEPSLVASKSKASVEVVRMLDSHRAEARIVEDRVNDPVLPGDQIFSQVWAPGQVKHFALCGFMDVDGDNESDRKKIKNLIASNGGVVDAEVTDDGKRVGNMSINTNYIVMGAPPNDKAVSPEYLKAYSELLAEGTSLGLRRINLDDFLDNMGYVLEERSVAMDGTGDASDFKPKARQGATPKADPRFAPRVPRPASSRPTAY